MEKKTKAQKYFQKFEEMQKTKLSVDLIVLDSDLVRAGHLHEILNLNFNIVIAKKIHKTK